MASEHATFFCFDYEQSFCVKRCFPAIASFLSRCIQAFIYLLLFLAFQAGCLKLLFRMNFMLHDFVAVILFISLKFLFLCDIFNISCLVIDVCQSMHFIPVFSHKFDISIDQFYETKSQQTLSLVRYQNRVWFDVIRRILKLLQRAFLSSAIRNVKRRMCMWQNEWSDKRYKKMQ